MAYLWVAIGGAFGSVARFWVSGLVAERFAHTFLAAATMTEGHAAASPAFREFFMVGICGGYTTFSSFSLQTLYLLRDREWLYAGGNVAISVLLCLIAVWLGYIAGSAIFSPKGH
jgi:CrcB protein